VPKPEPKAEKPDPHAAEIARKARLEEDRKAKDAAEREKKEREKKEAEKREVARKAQDEQKRLAEARDRQAREAQDLKLQAEREKAARDAQQKAQDAETAARTRAEADYIRRIQAKVKGNVTLPPDLPGNPEAIFDVVQLPTGEIIDAVVRKSSGVRAYDEAVQRAIQKSSPLPRPDRPELFQRTLTLKFRPQD
jgi:colicin import membrane protein